MIRIRSTGPEAIAVGGGHLTNSAPAMWHETISSTDATSLCRWAKIHLTYSCLPQSHRMKFDSIDHLFILEQQFWNILLVIEFPDIFFL